MALVIKDRVKETTTTTGTGNLNLAGAVSGFQSFVSGIGDTNTVYYALIDDNGTAWEIGLGTVSDGDPDTLSRPDNASVIASTNSNNRISLSSGTHTVFATYPAGKAVYLDSSGVLSHSIVNADISGSASIANSKLANSSVSFGGVSVALGASDATPAFDLSDATSYPTSSLSGTITNAQLAGSIANAKLANDGITIAGTDTSLGGSITADTIAGQISANTIAFTQIADLARGSILYGNGSAATAELTKGSANTVLQSDGTDISWGTVTNAMLAGSIANAKLANDSVSYGGVSLDLGGSDATPAFDLSDATNYPTSSLSGTITNAQLAGSIANAKLANASVSFGGVSVALGASDATPAFDLADATNYPTSSLSGTITNAQLAGSIANAKLANDSVSFGGVTVALGASDATPAFDLSDATSYPTSSLSGTITNAQLAGSIANAKLANSAITVAVGSDSTAISLGGTMTFAGTANEVEVAESSGTVTIGLPSSITANLTGNVTGNTSGSSGSCTGNAATATKLAATVDINGVAFDGSGDITITAAGSTLSDTVTVAKGGTGATSLNNLITLGTHTTGNYVATVADAGSSRITVANSGSETAGVTLDIADNAVGIAQLAGIARGKIIVGDASGNPALLAVGSENEVLTVDSNGDAVWAAASGGGGISHDGSTANGVLTYKDSDEATVEATLTYDGTTLLASSTTDNTPPIVLLKHAFNDTTGSILKFVLDRGAAGTDGDVCGTITFYGDDDNQDNIEFARIEGIVADASNGDECGGLKFYVAENDGTNTAGLLLTGSTTDGEVDVTVGAGAASVVTIPGHIDLAGDIDVDGTLEADAITLGGTALGSLYSPIAGSSSIVTVGALDAGSITSGFGTIATGDTISGTTITASTALKTVLIEYTDGDDAITIHDGGSISVAQAVYHPIANAEAEPEDATVNIDLRKANYFDVELNANVTDIDFTYGKVGQRFMIRFEQDASSGPYTIAWDAVTMDFDGGGSAVAVTISWPGGTAPTMTATDDKADTYGFIIRAEGHMDGFVIGQNMPVNDN